jgi:hypothetical protein
VFCNLHSTFSRCVTGRTWGGGWKLGVEEDALVADVGPSIVIGGTSCQDGIEIYDWGPRRPTTPSTETAFYEYGTLVQSQGLSV